MKKCLKVTISVENIPKDFLKKVIQKYANSFKVEGAAQLAADESIKIIACGKKEAVDDFLDILHKETAKFKLNDLLVEPFLKEKDYRGVFRVIE